MFRIVPCVPLKKNLELPGLESWDPPLWKNLLLQQRRRKGPQRKRLKLCHMIDDIYMISDIPILYYTSLLHLSSTSYHIFLDSQIFPLFVISIHFPSINEKYMSWMANQTHQIRCHWMFSSDSSGTKHGWESDYEQPWTHFPHLSHTFAYC